MQVDRINYRHTFLFWSSLNSNHTQKRVSVINSVWTCVLWFPLSNNHTQPIICAWEHVTCMILYSYSPVPVIGDYLGQMRENENHYYLYYYTLIFSHIKKFVYLYVINIFYWIKGKLVMFNKLQIEHLF